MTWLDIQNRLDLTKPSIQAFFSKIFIRGASQKHQKLFLFNRVVPIDHNGIQSVDNIDGIESESEISEDWTVPVAWSNKKVKTNCLQEKILFLWKVGHSNGLKLVVAANRSRPRDYLNMDYKLPVTEVSEALEAGRFLGNCEKVLVPCCQLVAVVSIEKGKLSRKSREEIFARRPRTKGSQLIKTHLRIKNRLLGPVESLARGRSKKPAGQVC